MRDNSHRTLEKVEGDKPTREGKRKGCVRMQGETQNLDSECFLLGAESGKR
jgi:hypothetical protein